MFTFVLRVLLAGGALYGSINLAVAVSPTDYALRANVTTQTNPASIILSWPTDNTALACSVYRKSRDDISWDDPVPLSANATNYLDTEVALGGSYEYRISRLAPAYSSHSHLFTGIELPLVESRGKVILLVDQTLAPGLAVELAQLEQDLVGDGWMVLRHDVPRMAVNPADTSSNVWMARSNEVANVKALITAEYHADPTGVKAVFIFGRVAVPYSGDLYPDGHTEHRGAWPADVFYGDVNRVWTDATVNRTSGNDPRQRNVPGDGKFDQTQIASDIELQVGRVDLANLPAFAKSETELLRDYLRKNHAFRHRLFAMERRGLIDDHFGLSTSEPFAANGWRDFSAFFGASNTIAGDWLTTLSSQSYLWVYGCGGGTATSAAGIGTTAQFAASDSKVVFTMLYGSIFGDWDSQNNFLRAVIATPGYTLTSAWVGRPFWYFHHMALGETIGFSTRLSQNESGSLYSGSGYRRFASIALMGDPTLRMHVVAPPAQLVVATNAGGGVDLLWEASPDSVLGYHIYRAPTVAGPFTRLNGNLITATTYSDPMVSTNVYMVRAVKLEESASGSYYNASQGIFQDLAGTFGPPALDISRETNGIKISWPAQPSSLGFRLESASNPLWQWQSVTNAVAITNEFFSVTVASTGTDRLFRLVRP